MSYFVTSLLLEKWEKMAGKNAAQTVPAYDLLTESVI